MSRVIFYRFREPRPPTPTQLILRFIVAGAGLFVAAALVPGIEIGDWQSLLAGTAVFAIVNLLVRPIAMVLSCCLIILTFGLFVVVVNAGMLAATAWVAGQLDLNFRVGGFWDAVVGAIIISVVSFIANFAIGPPLRRS